MSINLKPTDELIVSATGIAIVYSIYNGMCPAYADVRADQPGNANTHASTKMAAISSIAVIGTLALVGKSPTIFTVGGAMILFETWKLHYANYGKNGAAEAQNQPG